MPKKKKIYRMRMRFLKWWIELMGPDYVVLESRGPFTWVEAMAEAKSLDAKGYQKEHV